MNALSRLAATIVAAASSIAAANAADLSVGISVPGVYGQLELGGGGYPPPRLIYGQPVVIERGPPPGEPLYLHVPPGQERQWRRYCRQYDACGRPVYFVREDWYRDVYAPRYREYRARDERRGPPFDRGGDRRMDGHRGGPGDGPRGDGPRDDDRGNDRRSDDRRGDDRRGDDRR